MPPSRVNHTHLGAANMFVDLERGAVAMVKAVGTETSRTVGHKYGNDVGHVTSDSMAAASNAATLAGVSGMVVV